MEPRWIFVAVVLGPIGIQDVNVASDSISADPKWTVGGNWIANPKFAGPQR